ncbi:hypothetical protein Tco_0099131, partial [Tanacetum coccineum]
KTTTVHEKTTSPRSCLRWQPTGRILKTVCLRWVPTGKTFASSTTKVESEPPNGSNADITNHVKANKLLISDLAPQRQEMSVENVSSGLVPQGQKASDYDNSDPVPPRQNVVPTAEKTIRHNKIHQSPKAFSDADNADAVILEKHFWREYSYWWINFNGDEVTASRLWLQLQHNTVVIADSQSAMSISCNPVQHSRQSTLLTRYPFIRNRDRFKFLVQKDWYESLTQLNESCLSLPHHIIILSDSDVEDTFSSTRSPDYILASPDYFPASPGNTSPNFLDDLTKDLLASLALSPFYDDPYMKVMQAYDATDNELPIPP